MRSPAQEQAKAVRRTFYAIWAGIIVAVILWMLY